MFAKLLLYVSAQQATAAHWHRGKLLLCQEFANDESGWARFGTFLRAYPDTPVYVMVDVVEEDFRSEVLPHATGNNRHEMLARKLKQFYRATPYSAAWLQGRSPDKRRDDTYLFNALTNPDVLSPWLNLLQAEAMPLAGIYLLPMVSQFLLTQLKITTPNILLISKNSAGLRQSFFQNQQLKASRLTPLQLTGDESDPFDPDKPLSAPSYTEEIEKTRFYLNSQRLLPRDDKLNIYILDPENALGYLQAALSKDTALRCARIEREEICKRLGLTPQALPAACNNAPHFIALGAKPPHANLAPATLTRGFSQYRTRFTLYALSIAVVLCASGWSAINLYLRHTNTTQIAQLALQTRQQEAQYQEVAKQFPAAPVSADNLLKAVNIAKYINENSRSPEQLMTIISHALDASPSIVLSQLKWKLSAQPSSPDDTPQSMPPLPAPAAPQNTTPGKKWQIGYIEGEVTPFNGDYRAAISDIQIFADHLKRNKAVESVTILQLPLDINSSSGLSGTTLEKESPATNAKFKLKLLLKQGI